LEKFWGPGRGTFSKSPETLKKVSAPAPNFSKSLGLRKIWGAGAETFLSFWNLEKFGAGGGELF